MLPKKIEDRIFKKLFSLKKYSDDVEGVVCACIVDKKGKILFSSPSFKDGRHAEYVVIQKIREKNISSDNLILYTTLEPCSKRSNPSMQDCTTVVIHSGIKNVVYAALDPEYSSETANRFKKSGIKYQRIKNKTIIRESMKLFNSTITIPLSEMELNRKKKLIE
jgi:pyrimidine deaminase RibD-like protein